MIYDRLLTIYSLKSAASPLVRVLENPVNHYYSEAEVFGSRFFAAQQAGEEIHMMVVLPRDDAEPRITATDYCIPQDDKVYRVVQAQYGTDRDGLPITTLSLHRVEEKYEILRS